MDKTAFIKQYQLQYSLPTSSAKMLRRVLKKANESFVIICEETKGVKCGNLQYYDFHIHCPTTSFANAYAHIGFLYALHVLPIYNPKYKKNKI